MNPSKVIKMISTKVKMQSLEEDLDNLILHKYNYDSLDPIEQFRINMILSRTPLSKAKSYIILALTAYILYFTFIG